jgi:hypothetical protein
VVRLSGLIVRSHPGQLDEGLRLLHISLAEDYLLRPESQFQVDPIEARAALAQATAEYLGQNLSVIRREIRLNVQQPMSPKEVSAIRDYLEQVIDILPRAIASPAPKSQALVSSLTDAGYDLLDDLGPYAMLANHFFDDIVQEARGKRTPNEVRLEVEAISGRSKVVTKKILEYIEKVQLATKRLSQ